MECCKDCPMRIVGCPKKCKMYIEEKAKHEEMEKQELHPADCVPLEVLI